MNLWELFDKITELKALEVHRYELPFPLERQRYYATRMRRRFPQRFKALSPARRTLELTCFLRVTLMDLVDTVFSQVEKRISERWSTARQVADKQRLAAQENGPTYAHKNGPLICAPFCT